MSGVLGVDRIQAQVTTVQYKRVPETEVAPFNVQYISQLIKVKEIVVLFE